MGRIKLSVEDDGKYKDSKGKNYHYRALSKDRGLSLLCGLVNLKFEYITAFIQLFFISVFSSFVLLGDGVCELLDFWTITYITGFTAVIAYTAADSRPKKSIGYMLPLSSKEYFARTMKMFAVSMVIFLSLITVAAVFVNGWDSAPQMLDAFAAHVSNPVNFNANVFLVSYLLLFTVGLLPLIFMENRSRVRLYLRCFETGFCILLFVTSLIFYSPEMKNAFWENAGFCFVLILYSWATAWKSKIGSFLSFLIIVLIMFLDEEIFEWMDAETMYGVYHMIGRNNGWQRFFVYLIAAAALILIPFSLRAAYRETQPFKNMRKEITGK